MGNLTAELTACLCCGGALEPIIDFGPTRLANTYGVAEEFPLAVKLCGVCYHLQLSHAVAPAVLYGDYFYRSGGGRTARAFFDWFARMALKAAPQQTTVLDIASNDGAQLDAFKALGLVTAGIDPAANLADAARAKGHWVEVGLFEDTPVAGKFDLITAQNVLAHTARPLAFLQKAAGLMHDKSRLYVVTSQADMVPNNECDTVYHEHVSYFNARSLSRLAERAGLRVLDIATHAIHGTSYIFTLGLTGAPLPRVASRIATEAGRGLYAADTYWCWALAAKRAIARFRESIAWHKAAGYITAGLGAAAKGISMLNMAKTKLDYLFDTTPEKQGKNASGMRIRPFGEISALNYEKVLFVILAWNFEAEVRENAALYRDNPNDVYITDK